MTVRMRDAEFWSPVLADADAIAGYGVSQGAAHAWTDAEWAAARATGKALWLIVFLGHDAVDAIAQAQARGCVGVAMDVEGQFTQQAIASGQPQAFGDRCRARPFPSAVYGTADAVAALGPHYAGTWQYGSGSPGPRMAFQWDHEQAFDESLCDEWFANPDNTGGHHAVKLNAPAVGGAATITGKGYYVVCADGGLFPFGDAVEHSYGSEGGVTLNAPVVGMAVTPTGLGYWMFAADGGVFPFGDAGGFGSVPGSP